jgi:hypothetical protein
VRVFHVPARWWRPCSFYGARCHRLFEKKPSIVSQEVPSPTLSPSVKRVGGGPKVNLLPMVISSFFFLLFSLPVKVQVYPFFLFVFQFQSLCFLLLIFVHDPFKKVFYVFNSVLKLQFIIYCFHQFGRYFFDLSFLPLDLLLKFY